MIYFLTGIIVTVFLYHIFLRLFKRGISHNYEVDKVEFRNNALKLITEFNRISNTNISILEDKIEGLRQMVELAEQKISELNLLMNDLHQITADRGEDRLQPSANGSPFTPLFPGQRGERYSKIYELASSGRSIEEIAKSVEMSRGEVKLVLGLKGRGE